MIYTNKQKREISQLLQEKRDNSNAASNAQFCRTIGISSIDFSNIVNYKWEDNQTLLSQSKWSKYAFVVGFESPVKQWKTAKTYVYQFLTVQLKLAQKTSSCIMIVDDFAIGKTYTSQEYALENTNAFYVRSSDFPTAGKLIKGIAQSMGLNINRTSDILFQDIINTASALNKPQLILDDAGFLKPKAWAVIHRLFNALEDHLSIATLGSEGLENEIKKGINRRANGYGEVFSRLGGEYKRIFTDLGKKPKIKLSDMRKIAKAQGVEDVDTIMSELNKHTFDLRGLKRKILKHQNI